MYELLKESLKEFMDSHMDWSGWDYVHKEDESLILFMDGLIDNSPVLQTLLAGGTEKDMYELLENLSKDERLSPIIICLEKNIVNNMKKRENLQLPVSLEIVRWFRRCGWKFPKMNVES